MVYKPEEPSPEADLDCFLPGEGMLYFAMTLIGAPKCRPAPPWMAAYRVAIGTLVVNGVTSRLHETTVQQCKEQAWPAHQHAEHVAFCDAYLAGEFTTHRVRATAGN